VFDVSSSTLLWVEKPKPGIKTMLCPEGKKLTFTFTSPAGTAFQAGVWIQLWNA